MQNPEINDKESVGRATMSFLAQELRDFKNWVERVTNNGSKALIDDSVLTEMRIRLGHAKKIWDVVYREKRKLLQNGDPVAAEVNKQASDCFFRGWAIVNTYIVDQAGSSRDNSPDNNTLENHRAPSPKNNPGFSFYFEEVEGELSLSELIN